MIHKARDPGDLFAVVRLISEKVIYWCYNARHRVLFLGFKQIFLCIYLTFIQGLADLSDEGSHCNRRAVKDRLMAGYVDSYLTMGIKTELCCTEKLNLY